MPARLADLHLVAFVCLMLKKAALLVADSQQPLEVHPNRVMDRCERYSARSFRGVPGRCMHRPRDPGQTQYGAKVLGRLLDAAGGQPALRPLIDSRPRQQVVEHSAPGRALRHHVAQPAGNLPHRMRTLARILACLRRIRGDQRPFNIGHIRQVDFPD